MKRCAVSGKRKWRDKLDVMLANAGRGLIARAYKCPHCGYWHATRRRDGQSPLAVPERLSLPPKSEAT